MKAVLLDTVTQEVQRSVGLPAGPTGATVGRPSRRRTAASCWCADPTTVLTGPCNNPMVILSLCCSAGPRRLRHVDSPPQPA